MDVDPTRPSWWLAHTLEERLAGLPPHGVIDDARGRRRAETWRQERVFAADPDRLRKRLAATGLDEPMLIELLGETPERVRSRFSDPPPFLAGLRRAWAAAGRREFGSTGDGECAHEHGLGLLELAGPLLDDGAARIRAEITRLLAVAPSTHLDGPTLAHQLAAFPTAALLSIVQRTVVLELNVLRVEGELVGETPHDRFLDFLQRLRNPSYSLKLLTEYPVLGRDLVRATDNWVAARTEFAARLVRDIDELVARLGAGDLGVVQAVVFDAGDSHRGGRSVGIVRFENDSRLVYKPRRLQVDVHFQELLRWLNASGADAQLRPIWVLDCGEYGWTEFVRAEPCTDREAVRRFYTRQGSYLALLHALAATDFHFENLIASGEQPVLVDLEALFNAVVDDEPADSVVVPGLAMRVMRESVLSVGLLPSPVVWNEDDEVDGVDMSGLSGVPGQLSPMAVPTWDGIGTDQMHLVRRRVSLGEGQNRPSVGEQQFNPLDFGTEIVSGYQSMYRLLWAHRELLTAPDGMLERFACDEVRAILRATRVYGRVLQEGYHPDLLRDALDRDRFQSFLWAQNLFESRRAEIASAELRQIAEGDVPIFTNEVGSRDLMGGDGTLIAGVLPMSGLDRARARLSSFSEEHLARQTWFLRASLTGLEMGDGRHRWPRYTCAPSSTLLAPEALLGVARRVGDRLCQLAIVEDERIAWLGLDLVGERVWCVGPTRADLYGGMAGIGLFLGYLAHLTDEPSYRLAAERTARVLTDQIDLLDDAPETVVRALTAGGFNELGGSIYALSHLSALWSRADLARAAARAGHHLSLIAARDRALDVIGGSAGAVLALLSLHAVGNAPDALPAARRFAARLVDRVEEVGDGVAWRCSLNPSAPLAGFSHGASGIAVALARLDRALDTKEHLDLVLGAVRFERSLLDPAIGNWLDEREVTEPGAQMMAWCHGAPGIGLARADLVGYLDDTVLDEDLRVASHAVLAHGLNGPVLTGVGNHSLCHGDIGNLDCLQMMADATGDATLQRKIGVARSAIVDSIDQRGWLCGVPLGVETPGLMSGLAGIGFGLLRLAAPHRVPSVLAMQPPRAS